MTSKKSIEVEYVLEPPDGGWGYVIAFSMSLLHICNMIFFSNFGIVFIEILNDSNDSISATAISFSMFGIFSTIVGLITNKVLTKYSLRAVGLFGSIIYCTGSFLNIFVQNFYQLLFTFGCLQGIGFGLMNPVVVANMTFYFTRKLGTMNSLCLAMISAIAFIFPVFIQQLKVFYGQFGTLIILAALTLHTIVAMLLMQPVEWHLVKRIRQSNDGNKEREQEITVVQVGSPIITPLPTPRITKVYNINKNETKLQNQIFQQALDIKIQKYRESKLSIRQRIVKTLDLTILKDVRASLVIIGLAAAVVADGCFVSCVPLFLYHHNFDLSQIALVLTLSTVGDFISRILQMVFNIIFVIKHRYCVFFGIVMTTIIRYILAFTDNLTCIQILLSSIGFFRSWIHVSLPLAIAEQCIPSRFPAAFGILMIIMSIFYIVIGSIVVLSIKLIKNDAFIVGLLASVTCVVSITWLIEMLCTRRKLKINLAT